MNLTELAKINEAFNTLAAGDHVQILALPGTKKILPAIERLGEVSSLD